MTEAGGGNAAGGPAEAPHEGVRWLTDEEQAAWRAFLRMQAVLAVDLNRQLAADSDLSLQDFGVLVALDEAPDGHLRPFELGAELGLEKSRLSHHLKRLLDRGLVERSRCPTDQRGWLIGITGDGRRTLDAAAPGHVRAVRECFVDRLSPDQLRALVSIAHAVVSGEPRVRAASRNPSDGTGNDSIRNDGCRNRRIGTGTA
jgi:DNA-binding MarR family transcriptional regulator